LKFKNLANAPKQKYYTWIIGEKIAIPGLLPGSFKKNQRKNKSNFLSVLNLYFNPKE